MTGSGRRRALGVVAGALLAAGALLVAPGCAGSRHAAHERNPVVFVHGWASNPSVWGAMAERFRADGWADTDLVLFGYDTSRPNAETAERLAARVDAVLAETGAARVDLVTHSMGALPARLYARTVGAARVDALVSLAGPNHGTVTALVCPEPSCREMWPGSAFLRALNADDETPGAVRYATWRSPCDLVVVPQSSPALDGAPDTVTPCLLHRDLPRSERVYAEVRDWIAANERGPHAWSAAE